MDVSMQVVFVLVSILVTISFGLSAWALNSVVKLRSQVDSSEAVAQERKEEIERRFHEVKEELCERIIGIKEDTEERIDAVRQVHTSEYTNVRIELSKVETGIIAIHARLDKVLLLNQRGIDS